MIEILGVPHHVYLIEVQEIEVDGGATIQEAVNDPHDLALLDYITIATVKELFLNTQPATCKS